VSPLYASFVLWNLWVGSWVIAAVWSRRSEARPPFGAEILNRIPTAIGGLLLIAGSGVPVFGGYPAGVRLWGALTAGAGWTMTMACAGGFAFAWWARLTLGDLWSGTVTRKAEHEIVERGPYGLVRHPIYTGIIVSAFATAIQIGMLANLIGAALIALGFWLKARLEERFLSEELGEASYADYRRKTPMLVPFWPHRA